MSWRSIEEAPWRSIAEQAPAAAARVAAAPPRPRGHVVLQGVLVTEPDAYFRALQPWRRRLTIGALISALYTCMSWLGSLLIHVMPVVILMGLLVFGKPEEDGLVSIGFSIRNAAPEVAKAPPKEPEKPPEPPKPPEPEPPKPPPEPAPVAKAPNPVEPDKPDPSAVAPSPVEKPDTPGPIGTGSSPSGSPPKADPGAIAKDPSAAVRQTRADDLETLRKGSKTDIVVVSGVYDHTEEVLTHLGVPHTVIEPKDLGDYDLSECGALIIDCSNTYAQGGGVDPDTIAEIKKDVERLQKRVEQLQAQIVEGEKKNDSRVKKWRDDLRKASQDLAWKQKLLSNLVDTDGIAKKLRKFVGGGGYLFTSDWSITLLEKAFSGTVRVGGYVGPKNVKIAQKKGTEKHPLLKEVFTTSSRGNTATMRQLRWQIDGSSYMIRTDSPKVEVLVESPEIGTYKSVVVTFRHDGERSVDPKDERSVPGGRVLHMLSHFADQADKMGDYALQNMLVNFLMERFTHK